MRHKPSNLDMILLSLIAVIFILGLGAPLNVKAVDENSNHSDSSLPDGIVVSEKLYGLSGVNNFGRVTSTVFRGAQPTEEGYKALKGMGVKTVINLRAHHNYRDMVEKAGMIYVDIPIEVTHTLDVSLLKRIVSIMAAPENQPVFIHCAYGKDRTGVSVASFRMIEQGWSYDTAVDEMEDFGFNSVWQNLKKALKELSSEVQDLK